MNTTEILPRAANRRAFLKGAGMTGLGLAAAAAITTKLASPVQRVMAAGITDADIVNFALNLEYLEAEFYSVAVSGKTLVELGVLTTAQTTGATTGGNQVAGLASDATVGYIANALQTNEVQHVGLLRRTLGAAAVLKPTINLAALGIDFGSIDEFLTLARAFEDVGVSAYLGAAPLIAATEYLETAGSILAVEAKHAGAIRDLCIEMSLTIGPVDSLDIPPSMKYPFGAPTQGLQVARTPAQVLDIVYGGSSTTPGGFYPMGMNGTIK